MDHLVQWFFEVPPVTRYWCVSILTTAALVSLKVCPSTYFAFAIERAFARQPWTLITSFCYYGPLSTELLFQVFILMRSSRYLEDSFHTKKSLLPDKLAKRLTDERHWEELNRQLDRYKTVDYIYYIFLICSSIVGMVTLGWYKRWFIVWNLGPILNDTIQYIWCRNNPDADFNVLGFLRMRSEYLPFAMSFLNLLLSEHFQRDTYELFTGHPATWRAGGGFRGLGPALLMWTTKFLTSPYLAKTVLKFGVAHFWWYMGEFLPNTFYYDSNSQRREILEKHEGRRFEQTAEWKNRRVNVLRSVAKFIFLPPWYWLIVERISQIEYPEVVEEAEEAEEAAGNGAAGADNPEIEEEEGAEIGAEDDEDDVLDVEANLDE